MRNGFIIWSVVLIISLSLIGLCIKGLALDQVDLSESLFLRGLSCLLFVVIFARVKKLELKPKKIKISLVRALISGLALTFFTLSYTWLTASAVAVLSNIDVPLLIVLGPLIGGTTSVKKRIGAVLSMGFLVLCVFFMETSTHMLYGFLSLIFGVALLCVGYFFIKKSMEDESEAVTILVPAIALIGWGALLNLIEPTSGGFLLNFEVGLYSALSGLGMFAAYFATMRLYELTTLAEAEFPALLASIVVQPLEMVFFKTAINKYYFVSSLAFVVSLFFILRQQESEAQSTIGPEIESKLGC